MYAPHPITADAHAEALRLEALMDGADDATRDRLQAEIEALLDDLE